MSELSDLSQTRHVQANDPLSSQVLAQPTQSLEYRLRLLEQQRTTQASTSQNRLIIPNVPLDTAVVDRDVVYFNANQGNFQPALAGLIYNAGQFDRVPASMALGVVVRKDGLVGDVMIGGYDYWQPNDKNPGHMFESGHTFRAGLPCYLSDTEAGKLTQVPPQYRVQIMMAMVDTFVVLPAYAFADTLEEIFTQPLGMRPVGAVRTLAPGHQHAVIVGFDGLEKHDTVNNRWRLTSEGTVEAHVSLGYCVADARMDVQPSAPCYVRVKVTTAGVVTVSHARSLAKLGDEDFYGTTQTLATLSSTTFDSDYLWSASLYNPVGETLMGQLWFRFTSADVARERQVIFSIPESFQGWKMVDDPRVPSANAVVNGDGQITRVDLVNRGVGFVTPPKVYTSGSNNAVLTAVLDDNGSLASIVVESGGSGYSAVSLPTILFDSRVTGVQVVNGGSGATFSVTSASGVVTGVTVTAAGTGYNLAPELQVIDSLGTGAGAVVRPIMVNDTIDSVEILSGGSGYTGTISIRVLPSYFGYWKDKVVVKLTGGGHDVESVVTPTTGSLKLVGVRVVSRGFGYASGDTAAVALSGSAASSSGATLKLVRDANGGITGAVVTAQGSYTGEPGEFAIALTTTTGFGALLEPILESSITGLSATGGTSFDRVPLVEFGVPLKAQILPVVSDFTVAPSMGATTRTIPVDSPGDGCSSGPTVTFSAPDLGGTTAVATAYKGGWVTRVDILSAGSGLDSTARVVMNGSDPFNTVTGYVSSGLALVPIISGGALVRVDIVNAGKGLTNGEYVCAVTGGSGSNGRVRVTVENQDGVVRVDLTNPGSGYTKPPTLTWGNVSGEKPVLRLMLLGTGAIGRASIYGEGGCWNTLGLQAKTWSDDFDTNSVKTTKPIGAGFYYNLKADPALATRYPARPVEKCLVESNGVSLLSSAVVESSGALKDPNADVGLSNKTLVWHGLALLGTPWDPAWHQIVRDRGEPGTDATLTLPGAADEGWRWWENLHKSQPNINRARVHVNRASRFSQTGKVASLAALAPLKLVDTLTGADSEGEPRPMTGQLTVFLDNAVNLLTPASVQVDLKDATGLVGIFFNDKGRPVVISSVLLVLVYQSNRSGAGVPTVDSAAKITVGTAAGGYRDIIGTINAALTTTPGVSTCLYASNQVKELTPDAAAPSVVIQPNETVYLKVDQPAADPILSQRIYARVKGQVL